jgi:hypothetical protein
MTEQQAYEYALGQFRRGGSRPRVGQDLLAEGLPQAQVTEILDRAVVAAEDERRAAAGVAAFWTRLAGAALIAVGLVSLLLSYRDASPGGSYVIPAGVFGAGAYLIIHGKLKW